MKERPILFNGPMVRAILEGRKTMTRRVVKHHRYGVPFLIRQDKGFLWAQFSTDSLRVNHSMKCPYGQPGDRLYVKETFLPWDASGGVEKYLYRATEPGTAYDGSWKPSIYMPRKASRITLEIVNVRVERVQNISEEDATAEGVGEELAPNEVAAETSCIDYGYFTPASSYTHQGAFWRLWDSINSERGFGWSKNPWVWVIEFKRV